MKIKINNQLEIMYNRRFVKLIENLKVVKILISSHFDKDSLHLCPTYHYLEMQIFKIKIKFNSLTPGETLLIPPNFNSHLILISSQKFKIKIVLFLYSNKKEN